ncbi:MAG: RIP metalloprotease RseP, partial [Acaryochloris sp. SU_5_25]|nr:RIP metalloprotease RseP [Acaryochloris sp. SU_5_25]
MPALAAILVMIGILGLLIAVHELGHFLAARLQGIYVNRFSIGFG